MGVQSRELEGMRKELASRKRSVGVCVVCGQKKTHRISVGFCGLSFDRC